MSLKIKLLSIFLITFFITTIFSSILLPTHPCPEFIRAGEGVGKYHKHLVCEKYHQLPEEIQEIFEEDGWYIVITKVDLNSLFFGNTLEENVTAVTDYDNKAIYIQAKRESIEKSFIHEIGHYVDWHIGSGSLCSLSETYYNDIYLTEKDNVHMDAHYTQNASEYFAESFKSYILQKPMLEGSRNFFASQF